MRNKSWLCMAICLCAVLQLFLIPVSAADAAEDTTQTTVYTEPGSVEYTTSDTPFGQTPILEGCRTLDGQIPLGGDSKILSTALSAFVYEINTDTIIYDYFPDEHVAPSGFTKMLTAVIALENKDVSDKVTVSTRNFRTLAGGSLNARLKEGEEMTLNDLLHCMILTSANDAALTIAEYVAGSEADFVAMMNEKAASLGCTDTVFVNCHGLDASGQYSTARDIARMFRYAVKNAAFSELIGTNHYTVPQTNKSDERSLVTLNYLLQQVIVPKFVDDRVTGGVVSYSSGAGASVFCTAEKNGISLLIISCGSKRIFNSKGAATTYGNFEDAFDLLAFTYDHFRICRLLHDGKSMVQFPVTNGQNHVVAQTHQPLDAILPIDARLNNLIIKYSVKNGGLTAPIALDEKVATVQIWYRSSCLAETELFSMSPVRQISDSELNIRTVGSRSDSNVSGVVRILGLGVLGLLILFVVYLIVNNVRRSIARNRRRRRRAGRRRSR